jgi:hypothetical protein
VKFWQGAGMKTFIFSLLSVLGFSVFTSGLEAQSSLSVIEPRVTSAIYDSKEKGTRVRLSFKVLDQKTGRPVNTLTSGRKGQFRVFQNDVRETSFETLTDSATTAPSVDVVFVLDTSLSMEDSKALRPMKSAARELERRLKNSKMLFRFHYYQFATEVKKMNSLNDLSDKNALSRFTSLYSAVKTAMTNHPDAIIVLFSDGADNRSIDNDTKPVESVDELEKLITEAKTQIHTVKLGIEDSNDFNGVDNREVLKRISQFGSLRYAPDPKSLTSKFVEVVDSIAYPYSFEYLSPRVAPGTYSLKIEIDRDGVADDNTKWKADTSFTVEYKILSDEEKFAAIRSSRISMTRRVVPFVNYGGGRYTISQYDFQNEFSTSNLTGILSSAVIYFRNVNLDPDTREIDARISISGPTSTMLAMLDGQNKGERSGLRISFSTIRVGVLDKASVFLDGDPTIIYLDHIVEQDRITANFRVVGESNKDSNFYLNRQLAVAGDFVDRVGNLQIFSWHTNALAGFED